MPSMINYVRDSNGNTWTRCQECGDSKKLYKAHCMVDRKGSTFCFKCGASTQLDLGTLVEIALGDKTVDEALAEALTYVLIKDFVPSRFSNLTPYMVEGDPTAQSFQMRDHDGRVIGWHSRYPDKAMSNEGRKGLGYVGDKLVSTPSKPLTVVEGPFDVLTDRHVCTFGMITNSALKFMRLQYVWLQPDPDTLDTKAKRKKLVEKLIIPLSESLVFLQGVIVGNADPDEATIIKYFTVEECMQWLTT